MPLYPPGPSHFDPVDLLRDFETIRPTHGELIERWTQNFTHVHVPKSNPIRALMIELVLSPEQAARGGVLPLDVPRARVCPRCEGTGMTGTCACDLCDGHGLDWETTRIEASLPPLIQDGANFDVPLRQMGVTNFHLRLHARIASA
jgi:hypothetical protein